MESMWQQLITLDRESSRTLQVQVRQQIVEAISKGLLSHNDPMPSSRQLSAILQVARNTIVLAYEQLEFDGYLCAIERKGYFVSHQYYDDQVQAKPAKTESQPHTPQWCHALKKSPSKKSTVLKCANWQELTYPFVAGQLDPNLIPINEWREAVKQSSTIAAVKKWNMDYVDSDDPMLIDQIQANVLPKRGIWAKKEEILLTAGTQNAIYLISSLLVDCHSTVGVEDPGYPDARHIFNLKTERIHPIKVDRDGIVIDSVHADCDVIYTTPSHQYPTGVTMSMARRKKLLEKAYKKNIVIIEDDYEAENNFTRQPSPALKSMDENGQVIYVGSFSKTFAPGLRLGYMVAPEPLIKEARALRRLMLRHMPANNQRAVALFISLGHYNNMFHKVHTVYKERWHIISKAIAKQDTLKCTATLGGSGFWVQIPKSIDAMKLCMKLRALGVAIEPGNAFFLQEPPVTNYIRIGYSSIDTEKIPKGLSLLMNEINAMLGS